MAPAVPSLAPSVHERTTGHSPQYFGLKTGACPLLLLHAFFLWLVCFRPRFLRPMFYSFVFMHDCMGVNPDQIIGGASNHTKTKMELGYRFNQRSNHLAVFYSTTAERQRSGRPTTSIRLVSYRDGSTRGSIRMGLWWQRRSRHERQRGP